MFVCLDFSFSATLQNRRCTYIQTFLQPSIFLQMIFMVVPLEQGVHNPQIMTRCPKGLENSYWVRTYSYNDISRLLLSSFRLHATARPHVQTSVFFVNKLCHLGSPMGSNPIGMLKYFWIVKSRIIENGSLTKRLAF